MNAARLKSFLRMIRPNHSARPLLCRAKVSRGPRRGLPVRSTALRFMGSPHAILCAHCALEPLAVRSSRSQSALIYLKMGGLTSAAERFMGRVLPLNTLSLNRVVRCVCAAIFLAQSLVFASDALSPQDALKHMKVGAGFEVELVASEPE